jgi:hypothetical protein
MWWVMSHAALKSPPDEKSPNHWMIDLTWANVPILDLNKVDHLVSLCDSAERFQCSSVQWTIESNIPFGVFPRHPVLYNLIWSLRENLPKETGTSSGDIFMDWRDAMVDLDLDILLA